MKDITLKIGKLSIYTRSKWGAIGTTFGKWRINIIRSHTSKLPKLWIHYYNGNYNEHKNPSLFNCFDGDINHYNWIKSAYDRRTETIYTKEVNKYGLDRMPF